MFKTNMRKISLIALAFVMVLSLGFGIKSLSNTKTANADDYSVDFTTAISAAPASKKAAKIGFIYYAAYGTPAYGNVFGLRTQNGCYVFKLDSKSNMSAVIGSNNSEKDNKYKLYSIDKNYYDLFVGASAQSESYDVYAVGLGTGNSVYDYFSAKLGSKFKSGSTLQQILVGQIFNSDIHTLIGTEHTVTIPKKGTATLSIDNIESGYYILFANDASSTGFKSLSFESPAPVVIKTIESHNFVAGTYNMTAGLDIAKDAGLPTEVSCNYSVSDGSQGSTVNVPVTWTTTGDTTVAGEVTATGTFGTVSGYTNAPSLGTLTAKVTIEKDTRPVISESKVFEYTVLQGSAFTLPTSVKVGEIDVAVDWADYNTEATSTVNAIIDNNDYNVAENTTITAKINVVADTIYKEAAVWNKPANGAAWTEDHETSGTAGDKTTKDTTLIDDNGIKLVAIQGNTYVNRDYPTYSMSSILLKVAGVTGLTLDLPSGKWKVSMYIGAYKANDGERGIKIDNVERKASDPSGMNNGNGNGTLVEWFVNGGSHNIQASIGKTYIHKIIIEKGYEYVGTTSANGEITENDTVAYANVCYLGASVKYSSFGLRFGYSIELYEENATLLNEIYNSQDLGTFNYGAESTAITGKEIKGNAVVFNCVLVAKEGVTITDTILARQYQITAKVNAFGKNYELVSESVSAQEIATKAYNAEVDEAKKADLAKVYNIVVA